MKAKFDQYVHEYTDKNGETRFAVGQWDEANTQYVCPLDARTAELTGCYAEFAKKPQGLGGYHSRRKALRRARYLFGK